MFLFPLYYNKKSISFVINICWFLYFLWSWNVFLLLSILIRLTPHVQNKSGCFHAQSHEYLQTWSHIASILYDHACISVSLIGILDWLVYTVTCVKELLLKQLKSNQFSSISLFSRSREKQDVLCFKFPHLWIMFIAK